MKPSRVYIYLLLIGFVCVAAIGILLRLSQQDQYRSNGFQRRFVNYELKMTKLIDLKYDSYYICGINDDHIYLGNYSAPLHIVKINSNLTDTAELNLIPNDIKSIYWGTAKVQIDSPFIYINDRKTRAFLNAWLPFEHEVKTNLSEFQFDLVKVISPQSMIIRYFNSSQKVFQKIQFKPVLKKGEVYIPKKEQSGIFEIDGFFSYNRKKHLLFYNYLYRNEFLCLDTNLKLLYSSRTIDTNSTSKIITREAIYKDHMQISMTGPRVKANKRGFSEGDYLYINSNLASDGETREGFKNYSVIDLYQTKNGTYLYSIKVPNFQGKKITNFAVAGKRIFVLYKHHLTSYQLH